VSELSDGCTEVGEGFEMCQLLVALAGGEFVLGDIDVGNDGVSATVDGDRHGDQQKPALFDR